MSAQGQVFCMFMGEGGVLWKTGDAANVFFTYVLQRVYLQLISPPSTALEH